MEVASFHVLLDLDELDIDAVIEAHLAESACED